MNMKEQLEQQIAVIKTTGERKKDGNLTVTAQKKIESLELEIEKLKVWTDEKPPPPLNLNLF